MPTGSTLSAALYGQSIVETRLETHQRPYPTSNPGLIEYLAMSSFTTNADAYAGAGDLFLVHTCRFPIERPSACGAPHRLLKHHLVFLGSAFFSLFLSTRAFRMSGKCQSGRCVIVVLVIDSASVMMIDGALRPCMPSDFISLFLQRSQVRSVELRNTLPVPGVATCVNTAPTPLQHLPYLENALTTVISTCT